MTFACPNGCVNPKPGWWGPQWPPPCGNCDAPILPALGALVRFRNREQTALGVVTRAGGFGALNWPSVRLAEGRETALNPSLNTIFPAARWEQVAFAWRSATA